MRTRSSRLFLILLHLVGVSTDLPVGGANHPFAIVLENVPLPQDGLEGLLREQDDALSQPFWLQDHADGLCLSPAGFSQCGDATLWYFRHGNDDQPSSKRRIKKRKRSDLGHALEYADSGECILFTRKQARSRNQLGPLPMGSCRSSSLDRVFAWSVNKEGVLYKESGKQQLLATNTGLQQSNECLWRVNATRTSLAPCPTERATQQQRRLAHLSLIQYQPASVAAERAQRRSEKELEQAEKAKLEAAAAAAKLQTDAEQHIPRPKDLARSHASEPLQHATVKRVMGGIKSSATIEEPAASKKQRNFKASLFTLKDTNPILFHGDRLLEEARNNNQKNKEASSSNKMRGGGPGTASYKIQRLQTHPYLAAAQDETWTDPQTGLEFPTDLCRYLGHDRKSAGRHTLTGVGYYTRTVLNIKVYGVALYVSKRDILADPTFEQYATMNADELRATPDFYNHLRTMPSPHDPTAGLFDRTMFLKLNMQLSLETMQSSLKATWQLLTEERKMLLINSSMQSRPAEARMLQTIQSPHNPGRCSCGQTAPPEYKVDRECCARGTELVFTWRKNGDLEIRVDGRIMDSFPRPDVAKGIFYEYMRTDDPIAADFSARVVDGFPFLLGPLAQVKGMPQAIQMNDAMHHQFKPGIGKAVGNFADSMTSHAGDVLGWVHHGATGAAGNVANAAKNLGATARSVGQGLERRRDELWNQVSALPDNGKQFLQRRLSKRPDELAASVAHYMRRRRRGEIQMKRRAVPRGRVFRSSISYWFGEDDEMAMNHGALPLKGASSRSSFWGRILFVCMAHLYLLLLLIVSLPGGTQIIKLVVRRPRGSHHHHQVQLKSKSYSDGPLLMDDSSTESSSSSHESRQLREDWGNPENVSSSGRSRGLISKLRRRRRSRNNLLEDDDLTSSPSSQSGMKKSLSYYL